MFFFSVELYPSSLHYYCLLTPASIKLAINCACETWINSTHSRSVGYWIPEFPCQMDKSAFTHNLSSSCLLPAVSIHTLKTPARFPQEKQSGSTHWPFLDWHSPLRGTSHLPSCPWSGATSASDMWPSEHWERWERPTAPSVPQTERKFCWAIKELPLTDPMSRKPQRRTCKSFNIVCETPFTSILYGQRSGAR